VIGRGWTRNKPEEEEKNSWAKKGEVLRASEVKRGRNVSKYYNREKEGGKRVPEEEEFRKGSEAKNPRSFLVASVRKYRRK